MVRILTILLALATLAAWAQTQPQKPKQWKDAAEYAQYDAAQKAADPHQKITALDQWKAKYPETDYQRERLALYLQAYQQLGDVHNVVGMLNELLALNPKDQDVMKAILALILAPQYHDTGEPTLDNGARVAQAALAALGDPSANVPLATLAHTMLGWVAMNRKEHSVAAKEFLDSLHLDSGAGQVDLWLANELRAQKTADALSQAMFFYARAATYDGPGTLGPSSEKEIGEYLRKIYTGYHGADDAGFTALLDLARVQAFPPDGFHIASSDEVAAAKEEALKKADPQLALWLSLKKVLTGEGGQQYFDGNMKGSLVPGGAEGVQTFRGTLLAAKPAAKPKELVVAVADSSTPEATLKLDTPLTGAVEIGAAIEFAGVPQAFEIQPFMVTFDVERENVKGLKMTAPSRPRLGQ